MTRREMLVGLGGILATGTCPAVLNNVPLCLVGNLEVDKMETITLDQNISDATSLTSWMVSKELQNTILIYSGDVRTYNQICMVFLDNRGIIMFGSRFNTAGNPAYWSGSGAVIASSGDKFHVYRY